MVDTTGLYVCGAGRWPAPAAPNPAPIYGRVLQGEPLSGSAPAFVVWGGRAMSPRWRLIGEAGIAREFATDALLVAYSVYYTSPSIADTVT
jgi:hypothetical protein